MNILESTQKFDSSINDYEGITDKDYKRNFLKLKNTFLNNNTAGFSHMINNIFNLIITCYINNLIPIIPYFKLGSMHNNGIDKITNFSEYIDYSNIEINGYKMRIILDEKEIDNNSNNTIIEIDVRNVQQNQIRWNKYFNIPKNFEIIINQKIPLIHTSVEFFHYQILYNVFNIDNKQKDFNKYIIPDFKNLTPIYLNIHYNKYILEIAKKIIEKYLKNDYSCIHSRRGDDVNILINENLEHLNKFTEQENIISKLEKNNSPKNVYIMMHPLNKNKYKKDKLIESKKYNFVFSEDIIEFNSNNIKNDNNILYCIETIIMSLAKIKISTYRHYLNLFGNNRTFYNDYLTEVDDKNINNTSFPWMHYN